MLNGSVNVLSWLYAMYALPTRGNYELWAPLLLSVVRGLFRRQQYRGLRREVVLSYLLARCCLIWVCFNFTGQPRRSEEHTSELQSRLHLVCRLLLEKKKKQ